MLMNLLAGIGILVVLYLVIGKLFILGLLVLDKKERQVFFTETFGQKLYQLTVGVLMWPIILYWMYNDK